MPKRMEIGVVKSDKAAKTRRVEIPRLVRHAKVRQDPAPPDGLPRARRERTNRTKATRSRSSKAGPRSRLKRWELVRVVTKSRAVDLAAMRAAARVGTMGRNELGEAVTMAAVADLPSNSTSSS